MSGFSAVATAGLVLTFAAPAHRVDLQVIGVAAVLGGIAWSPIAGPTLIGVSLPFFFFGRPLVGPLSVTPPGLSLIVTWVVVLLRHKQLTTRWPRTAYDAPLALFLLASLASLLVTEYPL